MARYAMISGDTVTNTVIADDKEATEAALSCVLVECADNVMVGIGYTYNFETGEFTAPVRLEDVVE